MKMYRSVSTSRVLDDNFSHHSSSIEIDEVPLHDTFPEMAKKEKSRTKLAETAIHVIPFVLLFCALVLWCASNPDVDVRGNSLVAAAHNEGTGIGGHLDSDGTGHLPLDFGDLDPTEHADFETSTTLHYRNR